MRNGARGLTTTLTGLAATAASRFLRENPYEKVVVFSECPWLCYLLTCADTSLK